MFGTWYLEHERDVIMRRVAVPHLIDAIHTTDYGALDSRSDLVLRLHESARSFESTVIPLGCRGGFEFALNPATHVTISRAAGMLPPLPADVAQAIFPTEQRVSKMYFRLAVRTVQQLQCPPPHGSRQSGYGCWSGDFAMLTSLALAKLGRTDGEPDTDSPDSEQPKPLHAVLDVKKHRTASTSIIVEAGDRTTSAKRETSGSSTANSGTASSGQNSTMSFSWQSSSGSIHESSSSISTAGVTNPSFPGECRMLGALSGASVALENAVFLYVGALEVRETSDGASVQRYSGSSHGPNAASEPTACSSKRQWSVTDFIVAINLCDLAVYLIYIAWHDNADWWEMTDHEYDEICLTPIDYERFKPQNDSSWACLSGFDNGVWPYTRRRVVAKVANNVHEWKIGQSSSQFAVGPTILPPDSVPVLVDVSSIL